MYVGGENPDIELYTLNYFGLSSGIFREINYIYMNSDTSSILCHKYVGKNNDYIYTLYNRNNTQNRNNF